MSELDEKPKDDKDEELTEFFKPYEFTETNDIVFNSTSDSMGYVPEKGYIDFNDYKKAAAVPSSQPPTTAPTVEPSTTAPTVPMKVTENVEPSTTAPQKTWDWLTEDDDLKERASAEYVQKDDSDYEK
jgi:cell division protein FtsN